MSDQEKIQAMQRKLIRIRRARGIPDDGNHGEMVELRRLAKEKGEPGPDDYVRMLWRDRPAAAALILERMSKAS